MTDNCASTTRCPARKEPFETIEPGVVRMYVCGVTPYASAHIGHAMSLIVFDVIKRYLTDAATTSGTLRTSPTSTTRSSPAPTAKGSTRTTLTEQLIADWHAGDARAQRPAGRRLSARHAGDPGHHRDDRGADRERPRLRGRRRRLLPGARVRGVRQALAPQPGRPAVRRADRGRRAKGRSARLRALEGRQTRRAMVGQPVGTAAPAGTSSARRCARITSAARSTSTAAAPI